MIPHVQIDDESNDIFGYSTLFVSDANKLCCLKEENSSSLSDDFRIVKKTKIFNTNDIRGFLKKSFWSVYFSR